MQPELKREIALQGPAVNWTVAGEPTAVGLFDLKVTVCDMASPVNRTAGPSTALPVLVLALGALVSDVSFRC